MLKQWAEGLIPEKIRWSVAPDFWGIPEICDFSKYVPIRTISSGRERVEEMKILRQDGLAPLHVVVKSFPRLGVLKNYFTRRIGTKAQRAFRAAQILREHQVGTPPPIALAEKLSPRGNVLESILVTEFVPDLSDFRSEMKRLLAGTGIADPATEIANLLQSIAKACSAFHDAGIIHRDLGNQNIGLRILDGKEPNSRSFEILFLDLDRVRIFPAGTLTWEQRGYDLARLFLPSELRWFFCHMYAGTSPQPPGFRDGLKKGLASWEFHCRTRILRHPIQTWKKRHAQGAQSESFFEDRGIWIWDEKTAQAVIAHDKKNSRRLRPFANIVHTAKALLRHGNAIRTEFQKISSRSFAGPINFSGALGMTLEASFEQDWETQISLLAELEEAAGMRLPILLRVYHHKGSAQWELALSRAKALHARGNALAFSFVQSRSAIREPKSWREMLHLVIKNTHEFADFYEIGHATNRSKWGIWDFRDYTALLVPALEIKRTFPKIRLVGPACIDFDLHSLPGFLSIVPAGTFTALSQHLYVDRRGAPENFQGKFDLVRKCAIHRAIARAFKFEEEKIIISETNWPLLGTGTYSPCGAFFCEAGGPFSSPPNVTEEDYAKFMCRYLLLAIASGHVSRIYWWRLVHRGFGLVDDSNPSSPRRMLAFFALKELLAHLAGARFERQITNVPAGTFALEFSRKEGSRFYVSWTAQTFPHFEENFHSKFKASS